MIACGGHTFSHARQNIQSFSLAINGFFSDPGWPGVSNHSYTLTGHASIHAPSPIQISKSTATLSPHIPNCPGASTGPQTLIPLNLPAFCRLDLKEVSIGPSTLEWSVPLPVREIFVSEVPEVFAVAEGVTGIFGADLAELMEEEDISSEEIDTTHLHQM